MILFCNYANLRIQEIQFLCSVFHQYCGNSPSVRRFTRKLHKKDFKTISERKKADLGKYVCNEQYIFSF